MIVLAAAYQGAQYFELYTVNWVLDSLGNVILILIVVVFQHDIRRMLTQVGTGPFYGRMQRLAQGQAIEEIVARERAPGRTPRRRADRAAARGRAERVRRGRHAPRRAGDEGAAA